MASFKVFLVGGGVTPSSPCEKQQAVLAKKNDGGGVPEKCERCPEKTGEVSRKNGTRNTKNTAEIITENMSSSSKFIKDKGFRALPSQSSPSRDCPRQCPRDQSLDPYTLAVGQGGKPY